MQNLAWQDTSTKRLAYIKSQFSTQEYFSNHSVLRLIEDASNYPILWFDYSDESIERLHFSVWWGAIARRTNLYRSAYIRDLYLFHELSHFVQHSKFAVGSNQRDWTETRVHEEAAASFFSEMDVYNLFPWLRENTFTHSILWDDVASLSREEQVKYRQNLDGLPDTASGALVKKYAVDNAYWCDLWEDERSRVEEWWVDLLSTKDMTLHIQRLSSIAEDHIPWRAKAVQFKEYLESSKT